MSNGVRKLLISLAVGMIVCGASTTEAQDQIIWPSWTGEKIPDGAFLTSGTEPVGVAWDPAGGGTFWVADRSRGSIEKFDADGVPIPGSRIDLGLRGESAGPIVFDRLREGLWVVDQDAWTIRLVHEDRDEPDAFEVQLPATGLVDQFPITGLACDDDCSSIWLSMCAGHCSRLYRIESPALTWEREHGRGVGWVQLSTFANQEPYGLVWVPSTDGGGGCLWSVGYRGDHRAAVSTLRRYCDRDVGVQKQQMAESLGVIGVVPWLGKPTLTVRDEALWAVFAGNPEMGLSGLATPLRVDLEPCECSD